MVLPIIGKLSWNSFFAGSAAAVVGSVVARPLLVGTVRAGYQATDIATEAWNMAKQEVQSVKRDALAARDQSRMESEIQQLREEIASLRAQLAKKS
jgi:uncharacterized small protein (DUF1192 family)